MTLRDTWKEQGYLVLPNVLTANQLNPLREFAESALTQWQRESTVDNQPMGFCYGPAAWVQLHLNHPRYHRKPGTLPRLLDAIAHPRALAALEEIFCEPPLFSQANLYLDPPGQTRVGAWHRDCQFFNAGDEAGEARAIQEEADPPREVHMHIPLVPTHASELVPGSHSRPDTPEELRIRREEPRSEAMPGGIQLQLNPGDLAFFHVNSIHRGQYIQGVPRRTIAVSFGRPSFPRPATAEMMDSWRGYVASYQPWVGRAGYLDGVQPATRWFFERFIQTYEESWQPEYLEPLNPELREYFCNTNN